MARIVLISDTHGHQVPIPNGDILIHAGDLTKNGTFAELLTASSFFLDQPHPYKVFIAGNHDFCFEQDKERSRKLLPGIQYLQDSAITVLGLKIYGSPWQPRFGDFAFNLDRGEPLRQVWAKIPRATDILITHTPPYGIGDTIEATNHHVGCKDLLAKVSTIKPKVHVFGHIHCGYGTVQKQGTTFVNACICDEQDQPTQDPIVLDV